jgi:hypothetical protein
MCLLSSPQCFHLAAELCVCVCMCVHECAHVHVCVRVRVRVHVCASSHLWFDPAAKLLTRMCPIPPKILESTSILAADGAQEEAEEEDQEEAEEVEVLVAVSSAACVAKRRARQLPWHTVRGRPLSWRHTKTKTSCEQSYICSMSSSSSSSSSSTTFIKVKAHRGKPCNGMADRAADIGKGVEPIWSWPSDRVSRPPGGVPRRRQREKGCHAAPPSIGLESVPMQRDSFPQRPVTHSPVPAVYQEQPPITAAGVLRPHTMLVPRPRQTEDSGSPLHMAGNSRLDQDRFQHHEGLFASSILRLHHGGKTGICTSLSQSTPMGIPHGCHEYDGQRMDHQRYRPPHRCRA